MTLEQLAVKHPYYCSDSNYFSKDANHKWESATEFLDMFEDSDPDMAFVFRWDVFQNEENGSYSAMVFIMQQRSGLFNPHHIVSITEIEVERFSRFIQERWKYMIKVWAPIVSQIVPC